MKALAFNEFGGPDKLRLQEVPEPRLGPSDVLVSVRACGLNHLDLFVREGIPALKTPLPANPELFYPMEFARISAANNELIAIQKTAPPQMMVLSVEEGAWRL